MSLTSPHPTQDAWTSAREDLDAHTGECVACYVDRQLARRDCTSRLDLVRWWRELRAPRASTLVHRLESLGVSCDCELLTHGYEPAGGLARGTAHPWERPRCLGVGPGSAHPCRAWQLRPRWHRADA